MFGRIRSAVRAGNMLLGYMSGLGILLMSAILFYEVVARYFFNAPTVWVQEVAVYLFMWTMLAGASYTLMLGKHVRIDLVFDRLPQKMQLVLDIVSSFIGAAFSVLVALQTYNMIATSVKFGKVSATMLRVPLWIIQLPMFLGFLLLSFQFCIIMADRIAALKSEKGEVLHG